MLQTELKEGIKNAMKAKDAVRLSVLRGLSAAITNELVAKGQGPDGTMSEEDVTSMIRRAAKQRKDSIEQFTAGNRMDLVVGEQAELAILESLLPAQMSREDILAAVQAKATEMGVTDKTKANQLMGMVMKDLKGKADGTLVKEVVDGMFA